MLYTECMTEHMPQSPAPLDQAPPRELLIASHIKKIGRETISQSGLISVGGEPDQFQLLHLLDDRAGELINDHVRHYKPWKFEDVFPRFNEDGSPKLLLFNEEESPRPTDDVIAAARIGWGTEEGLPQYTMRLHDATGHETNLDIWRRDYWVVEENAHGEMYGHWFYRSPWMSHNEVQVFRDTALSAIDVPEKPPINTIAYTTLQELATRVSHKNTGEKAITLY